MRIKFTLAAILVAMLAAFAGACGGSGDDPAATVEDFFAAVTDGDGSAACELITENGLEVIGQGTPSGDCEDTIEQAAPFLEQAELELTDVETTEEDGDNAIVTATVSALGEESTSEVTLVNEDGWKIEGSEEQ